MTILEPRKERSRKIYQVYWGGIRGRYYCRQSRLIGKNGGWWIITHGYKHIEKSRGGDGWFFDEMEAWQDYISDLAIELAAHRYSDKRKLRILRSIELLAEGMWNAAGGKGM